MATKAVISSTFDDKYLFFLPIVTWCWNKLGVDVICFMPKPNGQLDYDKLDLIMYFQQVLKLGIELEVFDAPEHKQATYAQCARLYAACLDLPENEILISSDVDMVVFSGIDFFLNPKFENIDSDTCDNCLVTLGYDLVPDKQLPMCFARANVKTWRKFMKLEYGALSEVAGSLAELRVRPFQDCLDKLLGHIEAEHFRGNYWGKDQETLYSCSRSIPKIEIARAKEGTQFATKRYDRDDAYLLERLDPYTIDFHMPRPGYEDRNFEIILTVLKYHYPQDNFDWLINYQTEYKKLL